MYVPIPDAVTVPPMPVKLEVGAGVPPVAVSVCGCVPKLIPPILKPYPPEMPPDVLGPLDALELADRLTGVATINP
jgi:hypothetical protein